MEFQVTVELGEGVLSKMHHSMPSALIMQFCEQNTSF